MRPLFDKVLRSGGYTAWVGLNDACARAALHFLREKGVRVPETLSVVGCDNDSEAFADGLSTYDFNMPGVVHAMVQHVLTHRRGPGVSTATPYTEIPGKLIVRDSSGFAPRSP
jgi:DNA-binding LacI/PurR family transcriptional regulator